MCYSNDNRIIPINIAGCTELFRNSATMTKVSSKKLESGYARDLNSRYAQYVVSI